MGLRRIKKVRRWAVFGPIPGNLESSSMSAVTDAEVVCMSYFTQSLAGDPTQGTRAKALVRVYGSRSSQALGNTARIGWMADDR